MWYRALILCLLSLAWNMSQANEMNAPGALGADMLPAGRSAARLELRQGDSDYSLDNHGQRKPLFSEYDNASLASYGLAGTTTHLQSRASGERIRLTLGYGVNENITVGALLGWGRARNDVNFSTTSTNPLITTAMVQGILSGAPYAYKPVADSEWSSMLDPVIGLRWRLSGSDHHSTVLAPSLRLGLAKEDDPDDLMDLPLEDGSTDILLGLLHVRQLGDAWDIKLGAQYTWQLPDHITARARASGEGLVPASRKERLERNKGDMIELSGELGYRTGDWRLLARLDYAWDHADRYHSPSGQNVSGLEANTGGFSLTGWAGLSWNGLSRYLRDRSGVPAVVSLLYRETLDGRNIVVTRDLYLNLTTVF